MEPERQRGTDDLPFWDAKIRLVEDNWNPFNGASHERFINTPNPDVNPPIFRLHHILPVLVVQRLPSIPMELLHSPYANRLGTNYTPSDTDVYHIRQLLARPRARVEEVDREIRRIQETLESLQRERSTYQHYIDEHQAILSPIRRVPPEILQCIFVRCLPSKHNAIMTSNQAPILLTHVCRDWRAAAHKMPRLWASLHIPIPHRPQKPFSFSSYPTPMQPAPSDEERHAYVTSVQRWEDKMVERRDIVRTWLRRAAGCKLSISITLWDGRRSSATDSKDADVANAMIKSIMDIVISFSHLWRRIEVLAAHPHICDLLAIPNQAVPYLEHVKVTCNPFSAPPAMSPTRYWSVPEDGLLAAPRLNSFHFKLLPEAPLSLPVNWSQLTELYFDGAASRNLEGGTLEFTPADAVKLLSSCPLLIRCRLVVVQNGIFSPAALPSGFNFSPEDEEDKPTSISLPHLKYLSIHEGAPLHELFSMLDVPVLNEVVFTSSMPPYDGELTSLVTLLKICGPTIRKLTFDYPCFTSEDITQTLSLVPGLTHLSLSSNPRVRSFVVHQYDAHRVPSSAKFSNALLAQLTPRLCMDESIVGGTSTLLPNLVSLSCKFLSPEFTEDALLEFIRARRSEDMQRLLGIAPLRKVHICFKRPKTVQQPSSSMVAQPIGSGSSGGMSHRGGGGAVAQGGAASPGCLPGAMDGSMELVQALVDEGVDVHGLRVDVSYACPMQKGVESFSPALGLAPEALVPYMY